MSKNLHIPKIFTTFVPEFGQDPEQNQGKGDAKEGAHRCIPRLCLL